MNQQQEQELLAQIAKDQSDLLKVKLKDIALEPFSGEPKNWKSFKIHLSLALSDLNSFSVLTEDEPFPVPNDPDHPTPIETALMRYYLARDRFAKRALLFYCKGEAAHVVMAGDAEESSSEAYKRLKSRYEGDQRSQVATLLAQLHERRTLRKAEDMPKHLQVYLDIARELRDLENPVPVPQLKAIISRTLPPGLYEHTIREDIRNPDPQAQSDIHTFADQLRHDAAEIQARQHNRKGESIDTQTLAMLVRAMGGKHHEQTKKSEKSFRKGRGEENPKSSLKCTFCEKSGHTVDQCWTKHPSKKKGKKAEGEPKAKDGEKPAKKDAQGRMAFAFTSWAFSTHQTGNFENEFPNDDFADMPNLLAVSDSEDESETDEETLAGQPKEPSKIETESERDPFCDTTQHRGQITEASWLCDSGASNHMTPALTDFASLDLHMRGHVEVASGPPVPYLGTGTVELTLTTQSNKEVGVRFQNVLFVPNLRLRLFSEERAAEAGATIIRDKSNLLIKMGNFEIQTSPGKGGRFIDSKIYTLGEKGPNASTAHISKGLRLWHERLGHTDTEQVKNSVEKGLVTGVNLQRDRLKEIACTDCVTGKGTAVPRHRKPHVPTDSEKPGSMIQADTCGPITPPAIATKNKLMIGFVDRKTKFFMVFFAQNKTEATEATKTMWAYARSVGVWVKYLKTDNGSEFRNKEMASACAERGVVQTFASAHTSEQNGQIERMWRTLADGVRTMLARAHLPNTFWELAAAQKVYVMNRITNSHDKEITPYQEFTGNLPDLSHIRIFGCLAFVVNRGAATKLDPRTWTGIYVGVDQRNSLMHNIYDLRTKRFIKTRDAYFDEEKTVADLRTNSSPPTPIPLEPSEDDDEPQRHSTRSGWSSAAGGGATSSAHQESRRQSNSLIFGEQRRAVDSTGEEETSQSWPPPSTSPNPFEIRDNDAKDDSLDVNGTDLPSLEVNPSEGNDDREDDMPPLIPHVDSDESDDDSDQGEDSPRWTAYDPSTVPKDYGQGKYWSRVEEKRTRKPPVKFDPQASAATRQVKPTAPVYPRSNIPEKRLHQSEVPIPKSFEAALASPMANHWRGAMDEEMKSLEDAGTWTLGELPDASTKPLACKWVYSVKADNAGVVTKFKARLVAKGCSQRPGVHFDETYSPVTNFCTIRLLFAMAVLLGFLVDIVDVKNAYLNASLAATVLLFMRQPKGYERTGPNGEKWFCKLDKALYGLRQSGREWNSHLTDWFLKNGFEQSKWDPCLFIKHSKKGTLVCAVWVDDVLYTGNMHMRKEFLSLFSKTFKVTSQSPAVRFAGIEVIQDLEHGHTTLSQARYVDELLTRFNMVDANTAPTPIDLTPLTTDMAPVTDAEKAEMRDIPYRELVGALLYIARCTRPSVALSVNTLSRFNNNPGKAHWTAAKRVLRYLKGTREAGVIYKKGGELHLKGFADADWAGNKDTRRSTTGYVLYVAGGPVHWVSVSQKSVSLSTYEAETIASSTASSDAIWVNRVWMDMMRQIEFKPVHLGIDNQASFEASNNHTTSGRAKHIDIRQHKVREDVERGYITTFKVAGTENDADILTKAQPRPTFEKHRSKMEGHLKMLIGWEETIKFQFITWLYGYGDEELPTLVDTACAPYSAIPEHYIHRLVFPTFQKEKLTKQLMIEDAIGGMVIVTETIKLKVTAKIFVKGEYRKAIVETTFMIVPKKDAAFILLGDDLIEAFGVETPEVQIWRKLGGTDSDNSQRNGSSSSSSSSDSSSEPDQDGQHVPEQPTSENQGGNENLNLLQKQPANARPRIDMSIIQVSFNINKIRNIVERLDTLTQDLQRQHQRGWAIRAQKLAVELQAVYIYLKGAATATEDMVEAKMEEAFALTMAKLEMDKNNATANNEDEDLFGGNAVPLRLASSSNPMETTNVLVIIPNVESEFSTEIVRGEPLEELANTKRTKKRVRGEE